MRVNVTIDELIEGFELFEDWEERYRYIIEMGRKLKRCLRTPRLNSTESKVVFQACG